MTDSGVDAQTFCTFEYDGGAIAQLQCAFTACLQNEVVIVGETGTIKVHKACNCHTALTVRAEAPS
eukprot:5918511-Prymnesium_polylepis.2